MSNQTEEEWPNKWLIAGGWHCEDLKRIFSAATVRYCHKYHIPNDIADIALAIRLTISSNDHFCKNLNKNHDEVTFVVALLSQTNLFYLSGQRNLKLSLQQYSTLP